MPSPWVPDTDLGNLRVLGKTAEECGELGQMLARCIIQGIGESEPVSGKLNRQALEEEIADVIATTTLLVEHFDLDRATMAVRVERKIAYLRQWFDMGAA